MRFLTGLTDDYRATRQILPQYKSMFRIHSHKKDFWYYGLCLEISGSVFSIVFQSLFLYFNALCDVYTVILKSNWIFCILLGMIFENYFLNISQKVIEEHFVYFLNCLSIYEEIHHLISSYRHSNSLSATIFSSC